MQYDPAGNLANETVTGIGTTSYPVFSAAYVLDAVGNRTRKTVTRPNRTWYEDYSYDSLNQLVNVMYPDKQVALSYDAGGNLISENITGRGIINYSYDPANQLTSISYPDQPQMNLSYDFNGNLSQKTQGTSTTTYYWDFEDRLTKVVHPDAQESLFRYNGDGQRVWRLPKGGTNITYLWSGGEVLKEYSDNPAVPTVSYFYGVGQILQEQGGVYRFPHTDGLDSVVAMTDVAGTLTDVWDYNAWGEIGPPQPGDPPNQSYNTKKFTGQINDDDTGLLYLRARYYDPTLRRFISKDPIGFEGGLNLYSYCGNNPVNRVDPSGNISDDEMIAQNPPIPVDTLIAQNPPIPVDTLIAQENALKNPKVFIGYYGFRNEGKGSGFQDFVRNSVPGGMEKDATVTIDPDLNDEKIQKQIAESDIVIFLGHGPVPGGSAMFGRQDKRVYFTPEMLERALGKGSRKVVMLLGCDSFSYVENWSKAVVKSVGGALITVRGEMNNLFAPGFIARFLNSYRKNSNLPFGARALNSFHNANTQEKNKVDPVFSPI